MRNINRVVLTCGLTRDSELRQTPSGKAVVTLRVAFATGRLIEGEWREKRNYVDVELWGAQAEGAERHLSKGRQVAVDGRLEWSEFETRDGSKRQGLRIVADNVQFLPLAAGAVHDRSVAQPTASGKGEGAVESGPDDIPF